MSLSKADVSKLLTMMAAIDKRTVGESDVMGWQAVLDDTISLERYAEAIKLYYQQHTKHLMPAELIQTAKLVSRGAAPLYGQPGEIQCEKCHGVHFPTEKCSTLVGLQDYGVQRFIDVFNEARVAKGGQPLSPARVKKIMARNGIEIPKDEEIPF